MLGRLSLLCMLFGSNLDSGGLLQTEFYSSQVHTEKPQPQDLRLGLYLETGLFKMHYCETRAGGWTLILRRH